MPVDVQCMWHRATVNRDVCTPELRGVLESESGGHLGIGSGSYHACGGLNFKIKTFNLKILPPRARPEA